MAQSSYKDCGNAKDSRCGEERITRVLYHADDFGITLEQGESILALSDACGGKGPLNSISVFVNSPHFVKVALLAKPFVDSAELRLALHLNLVEGFSCAEPDDLPLLLGPRGSFCRDFVSLLRLSLSSRKNELAFQIKREFTAQIQKYLDVFPDQQFNLRIDSHQHVHMIPLVFRALLAAADQTGCKIDHLRIPSEPLAPHIKQRSPLMAANVAKAALLRVLAGWDKAHCPPGIRESVFCGVILSGHMDACDYRLVARMEEYACARNADLEVLFHPVRVEPEACLDPENIPFTQSCASPARTDEAMRLQRWSQQ